MQLSFEIDVALTMNEYALLLTVWRWIVSESLVHDLVDVIILITKATN